MRTKKFVLDADQQLTTEQIGMVKEASKYPFVADDDNPELTDEQLAAFRRVHESRQEDRRRQNVTLRLTPTGNSEGKIFGQRIHRDLESDCGG